jgi:hypothetical protein
MIYFVSKNKKWCSKMREVFEKEISNKEVCIHCMMIQDFVKEHGKDKTVYVSPTNSLGRMEGGIDLIMSRQIFPNIHRKLARLIKLLKIVGKTGQYILPIGSAIFFPDHKNKSGLITTPVMYNSSSIGHTENVYISILTTLILFQKINIYRKKEENHTFQDLVITSHGCGNGAMHEDDSVRQIRTAYDDFISKTYQKNPEIEIELSNINPNFFCILHYQEKEAEMALIDQNEIKTIKIKSEYTIMDKE